MRLALDCGWSVGLFMSSCLRLLRVRPPGVVPMSVTALAPRQHHHRAPDRPLTGRRGEEATAREHSDLGDRGTLIVLNHRAVCLLGQEAQQTGSVWISSTLLLRA